MHRQLGQQRYACNSRSKPDVWMYVSCIMYVRWLPIPGCTIHVCTGTDSYRYGTKYIHSNMPPPPSIVFVAQSPMNHRTSPPSSAPSTWSMLSKSNIWLASIHPGSRRPRLSVIDSQPASLWRFPRQLLERDYPELSSLSRGVCSFVRNYFQNKPIFNGLLDRRKRTDWIGLREHRLGPLSAPLWVS